MLNVRYMWSVGKPKHSCSCLLQIRVLGQMKQTNWCFFFCITIRSDDLLLRDLPESRQVSTHKLCAFVNVQWWQQPVVDDDTPESKQKQVFSMQPKPCHSTVLGWECMHVGV